MIVICSTSELFKNDALNVANQMSVSNPFVNAQIIQGFENELDNLPVNTVNHLS